MSQNRWQGRLGFGSESQGPRSIMVLIFIFPDWYRCVSFTLAVTSAAACSPARAAESGMGWGGYGLLGNLKPCQHHGPGPWPIHAYPLCKGNGPPHHFVKKVFEMHSGNIKKTFTNQKSSNSLCVALHGYVFKIVDSPIPLPYNLLQKDGLKGPLPRTI